MTVETSFIARFDHLMESQCCTSSSRSWSIRPTAIENNVPKIESRHTTTELMHRIFPLTRSMVCQVSSLPLRSLLAGADYAVPFVCRTNRVESLVTERPRPSWNVVVVIFVASERLVNQRTDSPHWYAQSCQ